MKLTSKFKTMKTNDTNNFEKRTASQVKSILNEYGLSLLIDIDNQGDGNLFSANDNSIKTRVILKKAGFILDRCNAGDKICYFRCHK